NWQAIAIFPHGLCNILCAAPADGGFGSCDLSSAERGRNPSDLRRVFIIPILYRVSGRATTSMTFRRALHQLRLSRACRPAGRSDCRARAEIARFCAGNRGFLRKKMVLPFARRPAHLHGALARPAAPVSLKDLVVAAEPADERDVRAGAVFLAASAWRWLPYG